MSTVELSRSPCLALTIDDLPYVKRGDWPMTADGALVDILETLAVAKLRVMAFVIAGYLEPPHYPILDRICELGHLIGNHTYSHIPLSDLTLEDFGTDVRRADQVLKPWLGHKKYFRYPLLRTGGRVAKKEGARQLIQDLGYTPVWTTIDNDDWKYNLELPTAVNRGDSSHALIQDTYIAHIAERSHYYDTLAQSRYHRKVKHIIVLHANEINSLCLCRIIQQFKEMRWEWIDPVVALEDDIYSHPDVRVGTTGVSWLEQISPSKGADNTL
jgi:peptidoglycan/xylan/chitin deacetylase (PgdA/CDA1 family)